MHPMLMTMIADERAHDLRDAAEAGRRGRVARPRSRRRFLPHLPRRSTQVAHA